MRQVFDLVHEKAEQGERNDSIRTNSQTLWHGAGLVGSRVCGLSRPMSCKRRGNSLGCSSEAGARRW